MPANAVDKRTPIDSFAQSRKRLDRIRCDRSRTRHQEECGVQELPFVLHPLRDAKPPSDVGALRSMKAVELIDRRFAGQNNVRPATTTARRSTDRQRSCSLPRPRPSFAASNRRAFSIPPAANTRRRGRITTRSRLPRTATTLSTRRPVKSALISTARVPSSKRTFEDVERSCHASWKAGFGYWKIVGSNSGLLPAKRRPTPGVCSDQTSYASSNGRMPQMLAARV